MKPGEAGELLKRLNGRERDDWEAKLKLTNEQVKALLDGMGQVVKAIDHQTKLLAKVFG